MSDDISVDIVFDAVAMCDVEDGTFLFSGCSSGAASDDLCEERGRFGRSGEQDAVDIGFVVTFGKDEYVPKDLDG